MPTSFINFVKTPWELQRARAMYTIVLWSREYWCPYFYKVKYYIAQDSSTAEKLKVQCALVPDLQLHLSPPLSTQTPALFFIPSFSFSHLLFLPFYTFSILLVSLPLLWGGKILYKNLRKKTLYGFMVSKILSMACCHRCLYACGSTARQRNLLTSQQLGMELERERDYKGGGAERRENWRQN